MSLAIPPRFSFPFLNKLDPNAFVIEDRQFYPQVRKPRYAGDEQVKIVFQGAPNEMLLPLHSDVSMTAHPAVDNLADATPPDNSVPIGTVAPGGNNAGLRWGPSVIQYSRESLNADSLPLLENTNRDSHLRNNILRGIQARRACRLERYTDSNGNPRPKQYATHYSQALIEDLECAGFKPYTERNQETSVTYDNANLSKVRSSVASRNIPLGFYSDLVGCNSVIPIGLLAAYSSNGWSLDLELANKDRGMYAAVGKTTSLTYRDVVVNAKVVKILAPEAMQMVLSLYQKTRMESIGGVEFPLSLRLNSMAHRFYQFPTTINQTDYRFRLPTNDKSVRGVSWIITRNAWNASGSPSNVASAEEMAGQVAVGGVHVTRLQVEIGSLKYQCNPAEQSNPSQGSVSSWSYQNLKRVAHAASPYPHWQERVDPRNVQDCFWNGYANVLEHGESAVHNVMYGAVDFENMEHAEPEFKDTSSGIDVSQYGSVDVELRLQGVDVAETGYEPPAGQYTVHFCLSHDLVVEVSPQGSRNISQSVL